jgi:uncharacterized protein DUF4189
MPFLLALLFLFLVSCPLHQAFPYGAIAMGRTLDGREDYLGYSYNQPTTELAKQVALSGCQQKGTSCVVVREFSEMCVTIYANPVSRRMFFEFYPGPSIVSYAQQDAGRIAQQRCQSSAPGSFCHPQLSQCDTRQGTQEQTAVKERNEAAQKEAVEKEQRKAIAVKDCPAQPTISGGPWFSSTYKVGAMDEARRATDQNNMMNRVFCVKSIEYLSDAPNPFGGKAARARFTVYDLHYRLVAQTRDFPY